MPRIFSRLPSAPRNIQVRAGRVELNDLFKLFPELPGLQRRPIIAEQIRRIREHIVRVHRHAAESIARRRAIQQVTMSFVAKRKRRRR